MKNTIFTTKKQLNKLAFRRGELRSPASENTKVATASLPLRSGELRMPASENTPTISRSLMMLVCLIVILGIFPSCDKNITKPVSIDAISLNYETLALEIGEKRQLGVIFSPENATNQGVTYNSGDVHIATVSAEGWVTAISEGTTIITITTADGKHATECFVAVYTTDAAFIVANTAQWEAAANQISHEDDNATYTIFIVNDFHILGSTAHTYGDRVDITVTITGNHAVSLSSDKGNLLKINEGQTVILRDVRLQGHYGNDVSVVNVSGQSAVFKMQGKASLSRNRSNRGGGIYNAGTCIMSDNAKIFNSRSHSGGGGIYVYSGSVVMSDNASISENDAGLGGGIYVYSGSVIMSDNASISENNAGLGGGVYLYSDLDSTSDNVATFVMSDNAMISSNSSLDGGGVYVYSEFLFTGFYVPSFVMSDNAAVAKNRAHGAGGGVYNMGYFAMTGHATISNNSANSNYVPSRNFGGGVYNAGDFTMRDNASIMGNEALVSGGGLFNRADRYTGDNARFTMYGGKIWGGRQTDVPADMSNNSGDSGDALYHDFEGGGVVMYGDGTPILPHTEGVHEYTDHTIVGQE